MLHGGRPTGSAPVEESHASWRRSRWMMDHVTGRLNRAGVSVWLLRYGVCGWNQRNGRSLGLARPSPVPDARWALDEVRRELGDVPVVLLGHSMGGRTAVAVADDPSVVGVVALAPWLPPDEPDAGHPRASPLRPPTGAATASRRPGRPALRRSASPRGRVVGGAHDMGRVGHYMFARRSRRGTRSR